MIKEHLSKELVMTKNEDEDFENSTRCWICNNVYVDSGVKIRDHCPIIGKYRDSAHRECNVMIK